MYSDQLDEFDNAAINDIANKKFDLGMYFLDDDQNFYKHENIFDRKVKVLNFRTRTIKYITVKEFRKVKRDFRKRYKNDPEINLTDEELERELDKADEMIDEILTEEDKLYKQEIRKQLHQELAEFTEEELKEMEEEMDEQERENLHKELELMRQEQNTTN